MALSVTALLVISRWRRPPPQPRSQPPADSGLAGLVATEPMAVVVAAGAPLFAESPIARLQIGELVLVQRLLPAMRWRGKLDGKPAAREGPLVEVRRAVGEASYRMFQEDLGDKVEVPTASWICRQLASEPAVLGTDRDRCAKLLRRGQTADNSLFAYLPCAAGPCPVALVRDGRVTAVTVDGLVDGLPLTIEATTVLLATARWSRAGGTWTGGDLVAVALGGPAPVRGGEIPLDHVDARDGAKISSCIGTFAIAGELVRFTGTEQVVERDTGKVLASTHVERHHRIDRGGRVIPVAAGSAATTTARP